MTDADEGSSGVEEVVSESAEQSSATDDPPAETDALADIDAALSAVRREALKATLVYAAVDAAVVATVVTLLVAAIDVAALPAVVVLTLPDVFAPAVETVLGTAAGRVPISTPVLLGVAVGVLAGVVEVLYARRRNDPITWFERANPETAEALRTARDAVEDDQRDVMADALYDDVLDRLGRASGEALLDRTRLGVRLLAVLVLGLGATQVTAVGVSLDLPVVSDAGDRPDATDGSAPPDDSRGEDTGEGSGGLGDAEDVLGDPTDVPRGSVPDDVVVDPGGGSDPADRPYETGGFPAGSVSVEAEAATFAPPEQFADADLVRAYTVAIRQNATTARPAVVGGGRDG